MLNGFGRSLETILPKLQARLPGRKIRLRRSGWLREHTHAFFLTPEGECFHNATVTGGKPASEGPLALKRELRETETRLAKLETSSGAGGDRSRRADAEDRGADRAAGSAQRGAAPGGDAMRPTRARR